MKPSFSAWLRCQRRRDDRIGDLARDAATDPDFPRSPSDMEDYIRRRYSSAGGAIGSLNKAVAEWTSESAK